MRRFSLFCRKESAKREFSDSESLEQYSFLDLCPVDERLLVDDVDERRDLDRCANSLSVSSASDDDGTASGRATQVRIVGFSGNGWF